MNDKTLSIIVKAQDQASKTISGIGDVAGKVGEAFVRMTKVAVIAGAAAAAAFSVNAVKKAIDLNESINAVEKTFGDASAKIFEFGKVAAETAGLSMAQLNTAVTPIGAMLRNVGFSADKAADSSIDLGKRAADLASVFNTSLDDALTAIQAGLRGEADPLERFGVGLSEANVKAYALAKGITGAGKEMTVTEKATARLGLFLEQTDRFAGDFVGTADQAANKSRILAARFENQSAIIGAKLLPAWEGILNLGDQLIKNAFPVIDQVINLINGKLNELFITLQTPVVQRFMNEIIMPLAQALGTVLLVALLAIIEAVKIFVTWMSFVYDKIRPILPIVQELATIVGTILSQAFNSMGEALKRVDQALRDAGINIDYAKVGLALLTGLIIAAFVPLGIVVASVTAFVVVLAKLVEIFILVHTTIITFVTNTVAAFANWVASIVNQITEVIAKARSFGEAFSGIVGVIKGAFAGAGNWLYESGKSVIDGLIKGIKDSVGKIGSAISSVGGSIASAVQGKLKELKIPGFSTGGYTGSGGTNEVAGVVHKGEYVVPKSQVDQSTGLPKGGGGAGVTFNQYGDVNLGSSSAVNAYFDRINAQFNTQSELANYGAGV